MQLGVAVPRRPDGDWAVEGDADGYQRIEPGRGLQLAMELNSREAVFAAHSNGHHSPSAELGSLMTDILRHYGARLAHIGMSVRGQLASVDQRPDQHLLRRAASLAQ